ncbi:unnamed protein product [Cuscuta campestris]|uniref:GYF domain-containing protein n=1 Tax=Cuscuta campestris TaxID=132261 RepID=A0A484NFN9_9ASTE|nr:unnamed protein product [Cuscuta campestris]
MTKAEQDRLLSEKPKVVPDELEPEATPPNASEKDEEKSSSPEPEQINLSGENFRTDAEEPEKETMSMDAPEEVGGLRCFLGSTLREASDLSAPEPGRESSIIELSDDENGVAPDPYDAIWNYMDPQGVVQGPFPLASLSRWYKSSYFDPEFQIWSVYESQQQSLLLVDVLREYSLI